MRTLGNRLTYANVMATVAVFIALGGGAYAALRLPPNSVGTKQLKNGAVTAAKVKRHSLTGANIDSATLGTVPLAKRALHASSADNATKAASATNSSELGGLGAGSFVHGDGQLFNAHVIIGSATATPIVAVPGVGQLTASFASGRVNFFLNNGTGDAVDRTFANTGIADGMPIDPGQELLNLGGTTNDLLTVQLAWGSGSATHVVRLSISWFLPGTDAHVIVQGIAS